MRGNQAAGHRPIRAGAAHEPLPCEPAVVSTGMQTEMMTAVVTEFLVGCKIQHQVNAIHGLAQGASHVALDTHCSCNYQCVL